MAFSGDVNVEVFSTTLAIRTDTADGLGHTAVYLDAAGEVIDQRNLPGPGRNYCIDSMTTTLYKKPAEALFTSGDYEVRPSPTAGWVCVYEVGDDEVIWDAENLQTAIDAVEDSEYEQSAKVLLAYFVNKELEK